MPSELREGLLKITALLSYCGGPLYIGGLLKSRLGNLPGFLLTFLPVGLMVFGACYLDDDFQDRFSSAAVRAGLLGLWVVLAMHGYALWRFGQGVHPPDQGLNYVGIAVGAAWSAAYLRAARRWSSPS